jgi:hypothetical protein
VLFDIFWQMFERKVEVREENGWFGWILFIHHRADWDEVD